MEHRSTMCFFNTFVVLYLFAHDHPSTLPDNMYIYICVCGWVYTHIYTYIYIHMSVCIYIYIQLKSSSIYGIVVPPAQRRTGWRWCRWAPSPGARHPPAAREELPCPLKMWSLMGPMLDHLGFIYIYTYVYIYIHMYIYMWFMYIYIFIYIWLICV